MGCIKFFQKRFSHLKISYLMNIATIPKLANRHREEREESSFARSFSTYLPHSQQSMEGTITTGGVTHIKRESSVTAFGFISEIYTGLQNYWSTWPMIYLKNNINLKINTWIDLEVWHKQNQLAKTHSLMQLPLEVISKEPRQWSQIKVGNRPNMNQIGS